MRKDTYTEISEKKTSGLGYLILIALFMFLIIIGQTVFSDIKNIPERPEHPSYCLDLENLDHMTYHPRCIFTEIDKKYGLDQLYKNIESDLNRIKDLNIAINNKNNQIMSSERDMSQLLQVYDVSLQETIAEEDALLDQPEIRTQIILSSESIDKLNEDIAQLNAERDSIIQEITPALETIKTKYEEANDDYKTQMAYYNLKVFLLKLLFILPLFAIFMKLYLKYKKRDSPYTIIVTSILFASTVLFLQVVLVFLYQILPMEWFLQIFKILMSISILKYVIYYSSVIIVILILGGVVYYIQKKVYDPKKVAYRYLKNNKCPDCGFNLKLSESYCPKCGKQIKAKCSKCRKLKYTDLPFCPNCGKK